MSILSEDGTKTDRDEIAKKALHKTESDKILVIFIQFL